MRINLLGRRGVLGGGRFFGGFADAMTAMAGIGGFVQEIDYLNPEDRTACISTGTPEDINIHFSNVNFLPSEMLPEKWPVLPGFNIHWAVFESTVIPEAERDWLASADAIFVPSDWGRQVLIDNGLDTGKIDVVPEGVDPNLFHPCLRASYPRDDLFRILVVGKFEDRKGFPELVHGFASAFGNDDSVVLYLKSDSPWLKNISMQAYEENRQDLRDLIDRTGAKNIEVLTGTHSDHELFHFYNACDLLLFPSRAEGWGLPLLEAIACGMPVATTFHSGHTEFLRPVRDKCRIIPHEMAPMGPDGCLGEWAVASPNAIADSLREVRANYPRYRTLALDAARTARARFSWRRAAETCCERLAQRVPEGFERIADRIAGADAE